VTPGTDPAADVPPASSTTPAAIGPYQILGRLGAGGLGEVLRARDTVHGRTVAIKCVPAALSADPGRAAALRKTAAALADVSHPGLAEVYECGESSGELFLAVEYVPGQTLTELTAGRGLHPRRATEIALDVAEALGALHAAGLVHGDVRPDNIVITPKGYTKLIDAGLSPFTAAGALRASAGSRLGGLPAAGAKVLRYLSPEEAAGERSDARADVFALGAVLHEMLTGVAPFDRPTCDEIVLAVLQATPPAPSDRVPSVPAELDLITTRALSKSLDRRYPTGAAIGDDLRVVKSVLDAHSERQPAPEPPLPRSRRPVVLTAVLLLAVAAFAAWWEWNVIVRLF
jgi:serine/threonine protein kinase